MANPRTAWGIDIGNRALKAVKLIRDGDGVRIDDFEFIEHDTLLTDAGDNKEGLIQAALANFVQRHNFRGTVVSVGVSGQNSFARFVKLPPVEEKKIPEIVRFEAIQQIPFPLDDVEWSYQLFQEPDNPEVEVGIFAMRKELVNQHIKYFTDFDLNVQNVQMNPLAVYNALQYDQRFADGVAMVIDVGTENTDLLIADNQAIWMRSIPIGGSAFTDALVKAFKVNFTKAEDLKRNAATSKYARQIFQHMRPVFADLVAEIQRSIGFYSSVHREAKIGKIYALGGTFKLPGLQKYLQQNLQMPVERIDSVAAGAPPDPKLAAQFGDNLLTVIGAYGLAIQAMGGGQVNSSLLPRAIQRERMWQEKTKWFGAAAALFVAGATLVGARYFYENLQYTSALDSRTGNERTLKSADTLSKSWALVQGAGEPERTLISNLQTLVEGKFTMRDLLTELINTVPQPPEPLAKHLIAAGTGDAAAKAAAAAEVKKIPRGQRQIVQIDQILPHYDPALVGRLSDASFRPPAGGLLGAGAADVGTPSGFGAPPQPDFGGPGNPMFPQPIDPGGGGAPAVGGVADPTGKGRGFIVNMSLTCPLSNAASYVEGPVQAALMKISPDATRPNLKFAVRKIWILSRKQIAQDDLRKSRLRADYTAVQALNAQFSATPAGAGQPGMPPPGAPYGAPGAFGGGGFGPGGFRPGANPNAAAALADPNDPAFADKLTGETVVNDWEFEIAVAVELDPAPYVPPAPAAQATAQ